MKINFNKIYLPAIIVLLFLSGNGISQPDIKCGFADVILKKNGFRKLSPDDYQNSYITPQGHFTIEFDTSGVNVVNSRDDDMNGIPDFVEIAGFHAEKAWALMIDTLGFHPPYLQNGTFVTSYPLSLKKISGYGVTWFNDDLEVTSVPGNNYESWIELNTSYPFAGHLSNDPWKRDSMGVAVTISHEFFHAVQLGYHIRIDGSGKEDDLWWIEASAVFFEEACTPRINDYFEYLPALHTYLHTPVYQNYGLRIYGEVLIPFYLEQSFGREFMHDIWSHSLQKNAVDLISDYLDDNNQSWETLLAAIGGWICRGGFPETAQINHPDQPGWPEYENYNAWIFAENNRVELQYSNPLSINLGTLGNPFSDVIRIIPRFGGKARFAVIPGEIGSMLLSNGAAVTLNQAGNYPFLKISVAWGEGANSGTNYLNLTESDISPADKLPVYPNPVDLSKQGIIVFRAVNEIKRIKLFSLNGQSVFEYRPPVNSGEITVTSDLLKNHLASGIYIYQIFSNKVKTGKLFIIK